MDCEPIQALDQEGNVVSTQHEEAMRYLLDGVDFEDDLSFTAPRGDGERQGCEFEGVEERMNCEGQGQGQDNDGIGSVCESIEEMMNCEGQGEQGHGSDGECQENEMDRGKRKISYAENQSSSEFDDSSDEDYLQSNKASTDSETPSLVLEDLEVSSDEDVFKNPSKRDLMHKLRRVGMKFHDAKSFREVLRDWCIRGGFDIEYVKNEKVRVTAKCKIEGCNWRIHASPVMNDCFQIKSIQGAHTCARAYDNKLAKASHMAKRMARDPPNIPVLQLKNTILRKCKVDVSRQKVQRAKREAPEKIRGSDSVQYEKLWDYCETVRKFNPGSKLILKKLEAQILQSLIKWRDGNDNMFPIAMPVVQVENRENWTWFLGELLDDIGGLGTSMWSFISDRQKGLIEALKDLVPDSEHRFCLRHIYENFKMKFKSQELKEFFWKAASTTNKSDFERYMQKINELDPKKKVDVETASEWLRKINLEYWARAFFPLQTIATKRVQIDEYVDVCYKKSTYLRVYAEMIHAVPGAKDYVQTGYEPLKPPKIKTKRGRPKKLRRKGPNEMQTTSTRKGLTHTYTKCLGKGHNKRNCTNEPHLKSKFYKGISHEEILVEGSQIPPASLLNCSLKQQEEPKAKTRRTSATTLPTSTTPSTVEQTSVGSSAATHPTSTPPSSNVQTSVGSSATKHPISTHPSNQEIDYQGPRNDALMGERSRGSGGNTSRNKHHQFLKFLKESKRSPRKGHGGHEQCGCNFV
ncbi:hypothetical protein Sango_2382400 [Sesamum angolense]|uniref:Transposase MuDR plant domain-containing protein n=1 Tax=Sesamum angolense TaxID=2727404 RepID=A0AAE1W6K6_9LAMI|nr:hypothetical protein Sango_2382400 [Sesamum angolense]